MDAILVLLAAVALLAVVAHAILVWLTFRVSRQWGLAALLLPPVAWVGAFRGRVAQRVWAALVLGCLLGCVAFVGYGLREIARAIAIGGVSVGEPRRR